MKPSGKASKNHLVNVKKRSGWNIHRHLWSKFYIPKRHQPLNPTTDHCSSHSAKRTRNLFLLFVRSNCPKVSRLAAISHWLIKILLLKSSSKPRLIVNLCSPLGFIVRSWASRYHGSGTYHNGEVKSASQRNSWHGSEHIVQMTTVSFDALFLLGCDTHACY